MLLEPYVEQVHRQLEAAAALGDERTKQTAAALAGAAESAVRLAILSAVTDAAHEMTAALIDADAHGAPAISTQLDGDELRIHVAASPAPEPQSDDGDANARISLRLSDALKAEIERAANRESVSVNTWLVRTARAGLSLRTTSYGKQTHGRVTGWVTG
ncbi:hypothetical protein FOS14_04170 [Skermania sp. ID1734]|uniref:hypothetical protein n=1 Tax=Skermania sp. ID1734 TaxID=2597516 RepID=UPI00117CEAF8|nr:hypothetical protein [Skermania sp. ID1734]TSE00971.1 hypothetical protein FOS14_04170 [Skermania sp. ID1734]